MTSYKNNNVEEVEFEEGDLEELFGSMLEGDYVINGRNIVISGGIDRSTLQKYIMPIIQINKEDEEDCIPIEEREPIKLYISCHGGDVQMGLALVDVIRASKTPIIGINLCMAYSMGCLIFLACHRRYCYKHSSFLIHDGSIDYGNTTSKFKDFFKFLHVYEESIKTIILETTKISKGVLSKRYADDWYITAEQALEYGMIDEILTEII